MKSKMKLAPILALLIAFPLLTACGGSKRAGVAEISRPSPDTLAPCARPERHLGARDWEIMAGRIGDDLIRCGMKHQALAGYVGRVQEALDPQARTR